MKTLIVTSNIQFGYALQRYLRFIYHYKSAILLYSDLRVEGIMEHHNYNLFTIDIYADSDGERVNYGLQYGWFLEQLGKSVCYFSTSHKFKNGHDKNSLPQNCFILSPDISDFLKSFRKVYHIKASEKIMVALDTDLIIRKHE